jgi:hypothetical protein
MLQLDLEKHRVCDDPRVGDTCTHYHRYGHVAWTCYVVERHGDQLDAIMVSGSQYKLGSMTVEEWGRMCRWQSKDNDPIWLKTAGSRDVEPGDGTFTPPELPDYSACWELPEPYTGPICGETTMMVPPWEAHAAKKEDREPVPQTLTCTRLPGHDPGHTDSKLWIGWGHPPVKPLWERNSPTS